VRERIEGERESQLISKMKRKWKGIIGVVPVDLNVENRNIIPGDGGGLLL
jgi:hypothetical protein